VALTLLVKFLADASQLSAEASKASGGVKVLGKELDIGLIAKGALVAGAVGVAANAIIGMTTAAADDRAEQEKLAAAIEAAGAATATSTEQINAAIEAGMAKAFTDTEQRNALQDLVTATGDVGTATKDLAIAQDIARLSGVSLEDAAKAIAKAHAGQDGALRKLVPGLKKGTTALDTLAGAEKLAAGQADLYAKSSKGMGETGSIAFSELTETIGEVFLPILDAILPALLPLLKAFGQLVKAILPVLTPLIKLLGAALQIVVKILVRIVEVVVKVIGWFAKLIKKVADFLSKLGPVRAAADLVGGIIGGLSSPAMAPAAAPFGAAPGGTSTGTAGWSPVTIHAYGDPALVESAVIRALRRYDRTNGAAQVLPRWT